MQKVSISGLTLFFSAEEREAAELIGQACERSTRLLQEHWGLDAPTDCRIYVMTSWLEFAFESAPWPWKIALVLTWPFWALRARKIWALAGGWAQRYGRRRAIGVKPPRLLQTADNRIGDRIFVKEEDAGRKVQSIACHELTHAFTAHLQLPAWLQEGLAMVMVDMVFERPTVQPETLAVLKRSPDRHASGGRQKLRVEDEAALVYLYAHSYWLTRYIEETRPGLLKDSLSRRCPRDELESKIAAAYEKRPEAFWDEIDGVLASYFGQRGQAA